MRAQKAVLQAQTPAVKSVGSSGSTMSLIPEGIPKIEQSALRIQQGGILRAKQTIQQSQLLYPPQRHQGHQNQSFYPSYQPTIVPPNLFGYAPGPTTQHPGYIYAPAGPQINMGRAGAGAVSAGIQHVRSPLAGEVYLGHNGGAQNLANSNACRRKQRRGQAITDIVDPKTGKSIGEDIYEKDNATPSDDYSNRGTPQPPVDKCDQKSISKNSQGNETTLKRPLLKYTYTDDQWSPLNTSGKKVYDRDFLLKLRSHPSSETRPLNLPDLEVVLKDESSKNTKQSRLKHLLEKISQKSKPEQSNRPAVIDKSLLITITKEDEKKNTQTPKLESIEEAECSLVKKRPESRIDESKPQDKISIFLDKNNYFSCLNGQLSMEQIHMQLLCIMSDEKENSFDNVCSWISANVGKRASEPQFIRVLMTAILEISIEPCDYTWEFRPNKLLNLQALISRYIDVNKDLLELECGIAIQDYIRKLQYPSGVLFQIIKKLWDDNILSTDALLREWESNRDTTALTGKSVAMLPPASFSTSLKESDDESSDEEMARSYFVNRR